MEQDEKYEEEIQEFIDFATEVWRSVPEEGVTPEEAFETVFQEWAGQDGQNKAPDNHWEGNCGALCTGQSEYWLQGEVKGELDGPYAVWQTDPNGIR